VRPARSSSGGTAVFSTCGWWARAHSTPRPAAAAVSPSASACSSGSSGTGGEIPGRYTRRDAGTAAGRRLIQPEELAKTIDHTLLDVRATQADIERVCDEAREHHFATVCSFPTFLPVMVERLHGCDVKTCAVISYPYGADLPQGKIAAAEAAVTAGAEELDVVMNIPALRSGDFGYVRSELAALVRAVQSRAVNDARGMVIVKVVIEAPYLDDKLKRLACKIVADAGADFAKTATGVGTQATVEDVELMREALPEGVGVKASGGIRTLETAEAMINAGASRIGTASAVKIMKELQKTG
jgi:deoxyribose-phosphate aldolase